jgi:hypothetical protein
MNAIIRRLHRLEGRFGSAVETEYDRWLQERIESGRRRVAAAREAGILPPEEERRPPTEFELRRIEILSRAAWGAKFRADKLGRA